MWGVCPVDALLWEAECCFLGGERGPCALDPWQGGRRLPIVQSLPPLLETMLEREELDAAKIVWIAVEIPQAALHDRTHSDMVSG